MTSSIRTQISESGHALTRSRVATSQANARLAAARELVVPLNLKGVSLILLQVHFASGRYARGTSVGTHQHQELQLEYVVSGQISFEGPAGECLLPAGTGNLIAPGILHSWRTLAASVMLGLQLQAVGTERARFEEYLRTAGKELPTYDDDRSNSLMAALLQAVRSGELWPREQISSLLFLWLSAVLSTALDLRPWRPDSHHQHRGGERSEELCERALAFIRANYSQPLQVADIALQVGVSERHLNRLFRRHRQTSAAAELLRIRLEQARNRLRRDPNLAVKTVAYECGFNHHAYFSSCFRKAFGCRPSEVHRRG